MGLYGIFLQMLPDSNSYIKYRLRVRLLSQNYPDVFDWMIRISNDDFARNLFSMAPKAQIHVQYSRTVPFGSKVNRGKKCRPEWGSNPRTTEH